MSWKTVALGTVCDFQNGFAFKSNLFSENGLPILRISNIQNQRIETNNLVFFQRESYKEKIEQYEVKPNDLLIAMSGATTGKIGFNNTNKTFYLNQRVGNLKPRESLDKKFLYYFLSTQIENNLSISAGAAQPNLSTEQIKGILIPLPNLSKQKEVVAKLDLVFAEIDKAILLTEANVKNSEALFQRQLSNIFECDKDGWKKTNLKDIGEYFNGLTYSPKNVSEVGTIVLRSSNIQSDKIILDDIVRVNSAIKEKLYVRNGDILMCSRNGSQRLVGKTATINNFEERMTFGTFMMIVRSESNFFIEWFFKSDLFKRQIASGENTMINQITRYMLDEIVIPMPDLVTQKSISKNLSNLYITSQTLKLSYIRKLEELDSYKKAILRQAFNGELIKE